MEYRRLRVPGGCYFFTVVTANRAPLLIDNIHHLKSAYTRVKGSHPFATHGLVVLTDHLHAIWQLPPGDSDFSRRWASIKRLFSSAISEQVAARSSSHLRKRERGIWQRRFWEHLIRDLEDWRRHMDYLHYNPVKHGCCRKPAEWKHSTFARSVARGWYSADWGEGDVELIASMEFE